MLTKWNPLANGGIARSASQMPVFEDLFRETDRLFESAFAAPAFVAPAADIYETADALVLKLDLPGHDPKGVDIQIEGDLLTVQTQRTEAQGGSETWLRRERSHGRVARSFVLPNTVDTAKCEASYEHGVLTLTLPKREEAKPRSITVKVNS
jgi:HSP20 family protein